MVFVKFGSPIRRSEFECVQQFCVFVYNERFSLSPVSLIVYCVVSFIFKSWQFSWTYSFQQQNFVKQYYDNIMTVFFESLAIVLSLRFEIIIITALTLRNQELNKSEVIWLWWEVSLNR